jgi:hypothetical protein
MKWGVDEIVNLKMTNKINGFESFYFWLSKVNEVLIAKSKTPEI